MTTLVRTELEKQLQYHRNRIVSYRESIDHANRTIIEANEKISEHLRNLEHVEQQLRKDT